MAETNLTKTKAPADPWQEMRPVFLSRPIGGEQKHVVVGVNGRLYKVPRGKQVDVPLPLYERLMIMLENEAAAQAYRDKLPKDAAPVGQLERFR